MTLTPPKFTPTPIPTPIPTPPDGVPGVCGLLGFGVLGLRGVNGLAAGLNSFALGLSVDFLIATTRSIPGELATGGDVDGAERSSGGGSGFGTHGG